MYCNIGNANDVVINNDDDGAGDDDYDDNYYDIKNKKNINNGNRIII